MRPTNRQPPSVETSLAQKLERRWRLLGALGAYRLALSSLMAVLFFTGAGPSILGRHQPDLFAFTSLVYLGAVIASGALQQARRPSLDSQIYLAVFADILAITLLMHSSGGVASGLGMLVAVSIAGGSLLMEGRTGRLFAALATLAIISEQVYANLSGSFQQTAYTQAGMLGASFFAVAMLAHVLGMRVYESERLVTQRELDLASAEQLNDYIIQHMRTGILVIDDRDQIRLMNRPAWYLLGMPETDADRPLGDQLPELAEQLQGWRRDPGGERSPFRISPAGKDLRASFTELGNAGREGTLIFVEDDAIVARQAQQIKLASLGRLTASIAHEIRNPLSAINHAAQLLAETPSLSASDRRLTEIIRTNSNRVNIIVENVLQLSRRGRSQPEELSLGPWLAGFVAEFSRGRALPAGTVNLAIDPENTTVVFDPSQLGQIMTILCENAVGHSRLDTDRLRIHLRGGRAPEMSGSFLEVIDNGPGISSGDRPHLFEPFFTTRPTGTGLGLYLARELCECNQARLEYLPVPRGGSCFRIAFAGKRPDNPNWTDH